MIELGANCIACGSARTKGIYIVPEAMFRTGESFSYRECAACGSVQIDNVPADLSRYYDIHRYYSFSKSYPQRRLLRLPPARLVRRLKTELYLRTGLGRGIYWAKSAGVRPVDRILDIGCGQGNILRTLHSLGYRSLLGVDPFLEKSEQILPGVSLIKGTHEELDGRFEWIMLHHSFEHVADPRSLLASVGRLLACEGRALIRIPLTGAWAWRHYGADWVQIDAPRHLVLYSFEGFRQIIEELGFHVERSFYDSTAFQFWGSELVRSGAAHSGGPAGHFTADQMAAWTAQAERLNIARDGDQACFVLKLAGS
jgi:SAM-dependent methyltransferase